MNYSNLKIGENAPKIINVIVEIPKGSQNKYEFDENLGVFKLDCVLYSAMHYPLDYGFIPETRSEDNDHLDALIIGSDPVFTGCLVEIRTLALLRMIDSGESDAKILGVQTQNPRFNNLQNLKDVELSYPHLLKEITHFFERYKELQEKKVQVIGWEDKDKAIEEIKKACQSYKKN